MKKRAFIGSMITMTLGIGMMAYAFSPNKAKKEAKRLINNTMDLANNKIDSMK